MHKATHIKQQFVQPNFLKEKKMNKIKTLKSMV